MFLPACLSCEYLVTKKKASCSAKATSFFINSPAIYSFYS